MECSAHRVWGAARGFTGVSKTAVLRACLAGLAAVLATAPLHAISASTRPAGFVRTAVSGGSPSRHATTLIASPLLLSAVHTGRIQHARAASGAFELASETVSGLPLPALDSSRPHAVFVTSGTFSGLVFRVTGGSTRTITVENRGFDLTRILAEGDTFEVRPLHTFKTLFGHDAATVPFTAAADAGRADQLLVLRDGAWRVYWFTGSTWRRAGSPGDAGDDVVLPHDGIVVYRRTPGAAEVRFVGEAPAGDAILAIPAGAVSMVPNPFPVEVSLAELGLEMVAGWRCHARAELADQVQVCAGQTWRTYWHDGAGWVSSTGPADDSTIAPGAAMLVVRQTGDDPAPYALITRPYPW